MMVSSAAADPIPIAVPDLAGSDMGRNIAGVISNDLAGSGLFKLIPPAAFIQANTGSLGMGVSKAKGMALANRLTGNQRRIFVLTGDGELQEGQFWESLVRSCR